MGNKFKAANVNIAVGIATPTAQALVNTIKEIPIVYSAVTDPVDAGLVKSFEKASGKTVKYKIVERRPGDIAECFANPEKANIELNWKAKFGIDEMCEDTWRWQANNPEGFNS